MDITITRRSRNLGFAWTNGRSFCSVGCALTPRRALDAYQATQQGKGGRYAFYADGMRVALTPKDLQALIDGVVTSVSAPVIP